MKCGLLVILLRFSLALYEYLLGSKVKKGSFAISEYLIHQVYFSSIEYSLLGVILSFHQLFAILASELLIPSMICSNSESTIGSPYSSVSIVPVSLLRLY